MVKKRVDGMNILMKRWIDRGEERRGDILMDTTIIETTKKWEKMKNR